MGGNVAVMDIQAKPIDDFDALASKFNVKTVYIQTDVTKEESLQASFAKAIEELGTIDGLVPSAGIAIDKPFIDQTWDEFTRIQDINVSLASHLHSLFWSDTPLGSRHILRGSASSQADAEAGQG